MLKLYEECYFLNVFRNMIFYVFCMFYVCYIYLDVFILISLILCLVYIVIKIIKIRVYVFNIKYELN